MKKLIYLLLFAPSLLWGQTDATLTTEANTIKNETVKGANTATRVGQMFLDLTTAKLNVLNLNNPFYINGGNLDLHLTLPLAVSGSNLTVNTFGSSAAGIVPSSGGGTSNFLRADGTWSVPVGTLPSGSTNGQVLYYNGSVSAWSVANDFKWDSSNKRFVLGDGNGAGAVADANIGNLKSYYSTNSAAAFRVGAYFQSDQTAANSTSIQGLEGYTKVTHSTGTTTIAIGTIGNIELSANGGITEARSVQGGGNLTGTGTISAWKLFYGNAANSGGGAISTGYGLYIDTWPSGVTTKYNLYTADAAGIQYFSGMSVYPPIDLGSVGTSQNDYLIGGGTVFKINATAAISITGIQQGIEGRWIFISNTNASNTITFPDNSGSSSVGNKFSIPGSFTLGAGNTCQFVYVNSAWHLASKTN